MQTRSDLDKNGAWPLEFHHNDVPLASETATHDAPARKGDAVVHRGRPRYGAAALTDAYFARPQVVPQDAAEGRKNHATAAVRLRKRGKGFGVKSDSKLRESDSQSRVWISAPTRPSRAHLNDAAAFAAAAYLGERLAVRSNIDVAVSGEEAAARHPPLARRGDM